jgi:hypothetical protein
MTNEQKDRFEIITSTRPAKCQQCEHTISKTEPRLRYRNKWIKTSFYISKHLCIPCLMKMLEKWKNGHNVNPSRKDNGI